jgi:hypothetical protein
MARYRSRGRLLPSIQVRTLEVRVVRWSYSIEPRHSDLLSLLLRIVRRVIACIFHL